MQKPKAKDRVLAKSKIFEDAVVGRFVAGAGATEAVRLAIRENPEAFEKYLIRSLHEVKHGA